MGASDSRLTVGDLRKAIEGLDDNAPVSPYWAPGCEPGDDEPGVELIGFERRGFYLAIDVALFYLNDDSGDPRDDLPDSTENDGRTPVWRIDLGDGPKERQM